MEPLLIIRARPEMAGSLTAIAWEAKKFWGYSDSWMEAWRDELTVTADEIEESETWVAVEGSDPRGFYLLSIGSEGSGSLEHLWVHPDAMRAGIGTRLLAHALRRAAQLGHHKMLVTADPNAEAFYVKRGATRIGSEVSVVCGTRRELPLLSISPA